MTAYADIAFATRLYGASYITTSFDRDNDGAVDTADVELMFDIVTAEINSYLVGRIEMPLTTVPLDLKMRCVDMCIYRMCPDAATATLEKTKRFETAIEWLKAVRDNKIKLTDDAVAVTGTHLTQRAFIVPAVQAHYDQIEDARWFTRERARRGE
jgi:phage gp36-like protein